MNKPPAYHRSGRPVHNSRTQKRDSAKPRPRRNSKHEVYIGHQDDQIRLKEERRIGKFLIAAIIFLCILVYFSFQLFRQQTQSHQLAAVRSIEQLFNYYSRGDRILIPNRGSIVDRNMQTLAISSITYNVVLDVRMLSGRSSNTVDDTRQVMFDIFGITESEFNVMIARDNNGELINNTYHLIVARNIPHSHFETYQQWLADSRVFTRIVNGERQYRRRTVLDIHFMEESRRSYVHNNLAAPIIGFHRGSVTNPDGVWRGLESMYNDFLTGSHGRILTTMEYEGITTTRTPPSHGYTVVTTLDLNIQRLAEEISREWALEFQAGVGAVIVMNPFSGEILAMAQYPSFDANAPADVTRLNSVALANELSQLDPDSEEFIAALYSVWANFNISYAFEPGSTFKSNTIAMALEEGLITPNTMFYCNGFREFAGGVRIPCSARWGHGAINLTQALAFSCNVALMDIVEMIGRRTFLNYQHDFGFGVRTGIDLPGEITGLLFTEANLNAIELATSSFGQRFLATPIQSIASFAPMINGGDFMQPFVVSQVIDNNGAIVMENRPTTQRRVLSADTSDFLRTAMEYTMTIGTGRSGAVPGYATGGKTATGEQGIYGSDDFSWSISFIGYFPVEKPQYLIMTLVHDMPNEVYVERGPGNRSVAPMFAQVVQGIAGIRNIPPDREISGTATHIGQSLIMQDFVGMPVALAISELNAAGLAFELVEVAGNVVSAQFPAAGARISENTIVLLNIAADGSVLNTVPGVEGISVDLARAALQQAGFTPRVVFDNRPDSSNSTPPIVLKQTLREGMRLPAGTEITLIAGNAFQTE